MFALKKALVSTAIFIGGSLLLPAQALAVSCPATITGTALSGVICDFDTGSSVTVSTGGEVGGINQQVYAPANSFILNNGAISNNAAPGISIDGSSLSNGLANNGTITTDGYGILIDNTSAVSGGISNTGNITSATTEGLRVSNNSTINGGITNSGSIISNSANDVALLVFSGSVVNGDIHNTASGIIRAFGIGDGLYNFNSAINGNITNDGTIRGDSGLDFNNVASITGNITNNGAITGDTNNGIWIRQGSTVGSSIVNNGTITGGAAGISVDSFNTVNGSIQNQAGKTITGGTDGIFVNDSSVVTGGIQNHGTITGGTHGIFVSADSTVNNIDLFGGSRVVGAIDAVVSNINIHGDFTSEGTMSANAIAIDANSIFTMANALTVQNAVTNAGTLALGTAMRTVAGDYTQSAGGALKVGVQNLAAYGQLTATGTVDLSQSGAINVNVANSTNLAIGSALNNVISGATLVAPGGGFTVTDNSSILNFTAAVNGGGTGVNLTAVAGTSVSQSNAATGNSAGAGAALALDNRINANPGGDWQNVNNALFSLGSDQQVAAATNQTTPALMGATPAAIIETMSMALRAVQAHQESNSGVSAGEDYLTSRNAWLKSFGSWGTQDTKDGVVGYDSEVYGLIAGVDKDVTDDARLGVGASYFNSMLSNPGDVNKVDIDSYLATVYGSYSLDNRTDVNAQVDAGYNSSDSRRNITFGGLNRIATGSYDGWSFHAGTGTGRLLNIDRDTTITPQARLDYFVVHNQGYDESGAGVLNLDVASQSQDQLIPAVEVKANHKLTPELLFAVNAGFGYDLLGDRNTVSASFAGGGGVFVTQGLKPSPWVVRSGAGLTWKRHDGLDFTARYDRNDRGSTYNDQTVSLKLRMPF